MSAHTPGPWQYSDGVVDAPINGTSPPTIICEHISAHERGYGPFAERQAVADADGRLIAAAPDLLEALSGLLQSIHDGRQWREPADCVRPWMDAAASAIAKAVTP